jgi:hypothetical protein
VSIFSGNVACLGLKEGFSAETEPIFDLLSLAYQSGSVLVRFLNCKLMKKNQQTFFLKSIFYQFCFIDVSNNNFHV